MRKIEAPRWVVRRRRSHDSAKSRPTTPMTPRMSGFEESLVVTPGTPATPRVATQESLLTAKRWAYAGASVGVTVSVAANVAHSFIPPDDAPDGWAPPLGSIVLAALWPVLAFIAIEIFIKAQWPSGKVWWALRWLGLPPVAIVAAIVSYQHLSGLLRSYGESELTYTVGPLAIDGLMIMATGALTAVLKLSADTTSSTQADTAPIQRVTSTAGQLPRVIHVPYVVTERAPAWTPARDTSARTRTRGRVRSGASTRGRTAAPGGSGDAARRRAQVRELLAQDPPPRLADVATRLGVGVKTIQRDVANLERVNGSV